MNTQVIDNSSQHLVSVLLPAIEQSEDIRMAAAFMTVSGLSMIEPSIRTTLQSGALVEFLVGLDLNTTEPEALLRLFDVSLNSPGLTIYCYASLAPGIVYHPKMYLFREDDDVKAIVGSSNLTSGGLQNNIEVNIVVEARIQDDFVSDIYSTYNRLKFHPKRVIPDAELIKLYAEVCQQDKKQQLKAKKEIRGVTQAFAEKVKGLRRPVPTGKDLIGWPRLVYDALPNGEFTNQQAYEFREAFQKQYPENQNVEAKIRQQLQVLRDIGLIEQVGRARWRKL